MRFRGRHKRRSNILRRRDAPEVLRFLILKHIGSGGGCSHTSGRRYESRLFRKQFFGCRRQAETINPVMPKYFRLASGHRVIIR